MSINSYVGVEGLTINVETASELYDALDALHTQVMDNLREDRAAPLLRIIETAMDAVQAVIDAA